VKLIGKNGMSTSSSFATCGLCNDVLNLYYESAHKNHVDHALSGIPIFESDIKWNCKNCGSEHHFHNKAVELPPTLTIDLKYTRAN
jgi:uncharacterized protein with PIN domain